MSPRVAPLRRARRPAQRLKLKSSISMVIGLVVLGARLSAEVMYGSVRDGLATSRAPGAVLSMSRSATSARRGWTSREGMAFGSLAAAANPPRDSVPGSVRRVLGRRTRRTRCRDQGTCGTHCVTCARRPQLCRATWQLSSLGANRLSSCELSSRRTPARDVAGVDSLLSGRENGPEARPGADIASQKRHRCLLARERQLMRRADGVTGSSTAGDRGRRRPLQSAWYQRRRCAPLANSPTRT